MMKQLEQNLRYRIQKIQVVHSNKRNFANLFSHMDFNNNPRKADKFLGGCFTILLISTILLPSAILNLKSWYNDDKPYISSVLYPFGFKG